MSMYVPKGEVYDLEHNDEAREEIETLGLAGRAQSWPQAQAAIREFLDLQAQGLYGGPPSQFKLRVWRNRHLADWPWCLKWVPREEAPSLDDSP